MIDFDLASKIIDEVFDQAEKEVIESSTKTITVKRLLEIMEDNIDNIKDVTLEWREEMKEHVEMCIMLSFSVEEIE